ncbi:MAG: DUF3822 family protein [Bacteroidaceae bacterium]|nr:DUF3822 family protein [Bacteroidaceae bacterium]MBR1789019.1 DUF3822 family protein [Bacteroidaceae bacterium]
MLGTGNKQLTVQELSIRIYSDGFSFSTPQSQKDVKAAHGKSLHEALEEAFAANALLRPDYEEVNIYADYPSTRIPLDEFRSEEAQALYRLTLGQDSLTGMKMHYEMLPALEVIEVFAIESDIEEIILRHYPHATIHSYFGQLMNRMLARDKRMQGDNRRLYAHTNGRQLFLFSYNDGKLQFANSFEASSLSNQVYFLLYAWKQLGLQQAKDTCILLDNNKELEAELRRYLKNIECA